MYTYVVEASANTKKHEVELARVESRLIALEIGGRIEKLTILKSLKETLNDAARSASSTVVLIGSDKLVNEAMSTLAELDVTVGIIPIGEPTVIANALGIPYGVAACDILSARITAALDLVRVNNRYFLSTLHLPVGAAVTLDCDNRYQVTATTPAAIDIANFSESSNPNDGQLEVIVRPEEKSGLFSFGRKFSKASVFPFKKLTIRSGSESLPIMADGETVLKTPATIEVAPHRLKLIVGKHRHFA